MTAVPTRDRLLPWRLARTDPEMAEVYLAGLREAARYRPELAELLAAVEAEAIADSDFRGEVLP